MAALATFKLFELDDLYYQTLYAAINPDTGEIVDEVLAEKLNEIVEAKDTKLLNLGCIYCELELEAAALKSKEANLKKRREALEKRYKSLLRFIKANLQEGTKLKDDRVKLYWRKSESLDVKIPDNQLLTVLGEEFTKIEYSPMKNELKAAIKSGRSFKGVELIENQNLQID